MPTPAVRLIIDELDGRSEVAALWRRGPRTLMQWSPTARRIDIVAWALDNLTGEEVAAVNAAYGVGFPLPDWCVSSRPLMLYVPKALRLPGATAMQGGAEYLRRQELDQLDMERAARRAEVMGWTVDLQPVHDLARV